MHSFYSVLIKESAILDGQHMIVQVSLTLRPELPASGAFLSSRLLIEKIQLPRYNGTHSNSITSNSMSQKQPKLTFILYLILRVSTSLFGQKQRGQHYHSKKQSKVRWLERVYNLGTVMDTFLSKIKLFQRLFCVL